MGEQLTTEQELNKALSQFEGAITDVLSIYNLYGLGVYNERWQVTYQIEKIAIQWHARICGVPDVNIGKDEEMISIPVGEGPDD